MEKKDTPQLKESENSCKLIIRSEAVEHLNKQTTTFAVIIFYLQFFFIYGLLNTSLKVLGNKHPWG